jgi:hypothetical protein
MEKGAMIPSWVITGLLARGYKNVEPAPAWGPNAIKVEGKDGRVAIRNLDESLMELLDGRDGWVRPY